MKGMFKIFAAIGAAAVVALGTISFTSSGAAEEGRYEAKFNAKGELIRPDGWREWVFIGLIVTPNGLNDGKAPFPEAHSVYIDPVSWAHWKKTGKFREGTMIAKELSFVHKKDGHKDGSTDQVSGRGFFQDTFSGFEIALKSKKRYPKEPGNWVYFTYGHHAPPYAKSAKVQPTENCNACHLGAASFDYVFMQFYPVLNAAKPKK